MIPNKLQQKFKEFFNDFDAHLDEFGILNYSIQMTTLTEVFEKVGGFKKYDEEEIDDNTH